MIFVDTSALYAFLVGDDRFHESAKATWQRLRDGEERLHTHNYVLLETGSLLQSRVGVEPVRALQADLAPALHVSWVAAAEHEQAVTAALASRRRDISLVDRVSFLLMRRLGIDRAFAFDPHFRDEGFELVP